MQQDFQLPTGYTPPSISVEDAVSKDESVIFGENTSKNI